MTALERMTVPETLSLGRGSRGEGGPFLGGGRPPPLR